MPELPATFSRLLDGDRFDAAGTTWQVVEGTATRRSTRRCTRAARSVLISGDMLLPQDHHQRRRVADRARRRSRSRRFLDSLTAFEALPPDTLVLPSHGLPFRGIPLRTAQLRAHHAARLDELVHAVAAAAPAGLSAAALMPTLFRRELDIQQRFFAMGEAIAHLNHLWHAGRLERRVAADGVLLFALRAR